MTTPTLRLALLLLRGSRTRLALAVIALAVAAGGVCAIDLVNRAVLRSFVEVIDSMAGRAALQITAGDGGFFRGEVARTIAEIPDVELAVPVVSATAFTPGEHGELVSIFGFDLVRDAIVRVYEPRGGAGFELNYAMLAQEAGAMVVSRAFAAHRGLGIGDRFELTTPTGRWSFVVSGFLEAQGMARMIGGNLAIMQLEAAQSVFARPQFINRVDVVVDRAADVGRVAEAIAARLPSGLRVAAPAQRKADLHRVMRSLRVMLWGAAVIGVVLSFLVAFSRLATDFEARAWQIGVLRAAGLRRRAVWRELLAESLLVGVAGAALGIPLGIAIGHALLPEVAATAALTYKLASPVVELRVEPWSLTLAAATAVGAALLAAALPAWRASRVVVAETVRGRGREQAPATARVLRAAVGAVVVSGAALALAVQAARDSAPWGLVATALIVTTAALAARPLLELARGPLLAILFRLAGPVAPFAGATLLRNARRTALTVAMVAVGLGCVVWLLTLATSFEQSLVRTLAATLRADLVLASSRTVSGWVPAPVDDVFLAEVAHIPGVGGVVGNRLVDWPYAGRTVAINAFDPTYFAQPAFGQSLLFGERAPDVWDAVARGTGAVVSTNFARNFGTRVGDAITLETPSGPLALRVAGFTMAFMSSGGTIEMSRDLYARYWQDRQVNRVWVRTELGAAAAVREAIAVGPGSQYGLRVFSSTEMLEYLVSQVRRAFAPIAVLRALVLVVLFVGVADTLVSNVVQRVRELGVIRAAGVRRRYVRRMVLVEALVMGTLGLVLAVVLGLGLGALWVRATFPALLGWTLELRPAYGEIVVVGLLTLAVCLAAGMLPARRAARLEPGAALRYE